VGTRDLSSNNRRLSESHAKPAPGDECCLEYRDHKARKPYRIFADYGYRYSHRNYFQGETSVGDLKEADDGK